jgi:heme A synthase
LIPPLDDPTAVLEWSHRTIAALIGFVLVATAIGAWRQRHLTALIPWPMILVLVLLPPQIVLGAIVVKYELPPYMVLVHLSIAFAIIGLAIVTAVAAAHGPGTGEYLAARVTPDDTRFPRRLVWMLVLVWVLLMTGAYTRAAGASWVCPGFPLCAGELPFGRSPLIDIHLLHRIAATAIAVYALVVAAWIRRRYGDAPRLAGWAGVLALAVVGQFAVGVAQVTIGPWPLFQSLHVAGGTAVWAGGVVIVTLVYLRRRHARSSFSTLPLRG